MVDYKLKFTNYSTEELEQRKKEINYEIIRMINLDTPNELYEELEALEDELQKRHDNVE